MADARVAVGFRHEARPGLKLGAFFHAELPIGIEFVSGGSIPLAAVEDPIADRMRQWEASDRRDQARFTQAALLLDLASEVDYAYLDHRIIEETAGAANLATQRGQTP